jgi:hypothetical protein
LGYRDVDCTPILGRKWARKEKVVQRLFCIVAAQDAGKILKGHVLPFEQFPGTYSVLHEQPEKYFMFALTSRCPQPPEGRVYSLVST